MTFVEEVAAVLTREILQELVRQLRQEVERRVDERLDEHEQLHLAFDAVADELPGSG